MGSDERIRLFCSLELPADAVEGLVRWQAELPRGAHRLVPPENLHVTLVFLGSTPRQRVDDVLSELRSAAGTAKRPAFEAVRYRETRSAGMVVCADEDERGERLAEDLGGRLERLGLYRPESRPWLPHVTVVRFRARPRLDPPLPGLGRVVPSDAVLNMSVLRPTGAQYAKIESVALGG